MSLPFEASCARSRMHCRHRPTRKRPPSRPSGAHRPSPSHRAPSSLRRRSLSQESLRTSHPRCCSLMLANFTPPRPFIEAAQPAAAAGREKRARFRRTHFFELILVGRTDSTEGTIIIEMRHWSSSKTLQSYGVRGEGKECTLQSGEFTKRARRCPVPPSAKSTKEM